ncbi:MAG: hypothetical protein P1P63_01305 [Treponemataceae bacterium]
MKTTNKAYEAIMERLTQIENAAVRGALDGNARDCYVEIKSLVFETRRVLNENFYIPSTEAGV